MSDVFDWIRLIGVRVPRGEDPPWLQEAFEGTLAPDRVTFIEETPGTLIVEVDGKRWKISV